MWIIGEEINFCVAPKSQIVCPCFLNISLELYCAWCPFTTQIAMVSDTVLNCFIMSGSCCSYDNNIIDDMGNIIDDMGNINALINAPTAVESATHTEVKWCKKKKRVCNPPHIFYQGITAKQNTLVNVFKRRQKSTPRPQKDPGAGMAGEVEKHSSRRRKWTMHTKGSPAS